MNVFVAGPRAITKLNLDIESRLNSVISSGFTILVGDANGVDRLAQQFLFLQKYQHVVVYASNGKARNNIGNWPIKKVEVAQGIKGFEFYTCKDKQMALDADYGFMVWNGKSKGTLNNIINLTTSHKKALVYFTPHKKFYCLETLEQVQKFSAACGDDAQLLYSTLLTQGNLKPTKLNDSGQLSLFG